MKELKFNLMYLLKRKEFYYAIIGVLLINLFHIIFTIHYMCNTGDFYETGYKAEYLSILYSLDVNFNMIIIILLPIICSLIYSDINWIENNQKINYILKSRLNYKNNIICRFFLIIIISFSLTFLAFMLNYLTLRNIYGSGNSITYFNDPAYNLVLKKNFFLDSLRIINPPLFVAAICAHISLLLGLLSSLSYSISFYIKQRIIIYITPFLVIIVSTFITSLAKIEKFSIANQLQPMSTFSISDANVLYIFLLILGILLLIKPLKRADNL